MKKRTQIIILITSLLILIGTSIFTYALLESKVVKDEVTFTVGNLDFEFQGSIDNILIPGKNIVEKEFKLINKSTIEIDLIIEYEILIDNKNIITENIEGIIIDTSFEKENNKYVKRIDKTTNKEIDIISNIELDGRYIKSSFSNQDFKIIFKIKAKQHKNVTWDEILITK